MVLSVGNLGIALNNQFNVDELDYSNQDSGIMHIGKIVDTLTIENLNTTLNTTLNKANIALLGFGQLPDSLIIRDCKIMSNFVIFDTESLFDFLDGDAYLSMSSLYISGEVYGGEINLPTLFGVSHTGKIKIGHLDVSDLKFTQTVNIDTIENDPAINFFASDIGKITLPDNKESHILVQIIKQKFKSIADIEYR